MPWLAGMKALPFWQTFSVLPLAAAQEKRQNPRVSVILFCLSRAPVITEHISHPAQHFLQEELTYVGKDSKQPLLLTPSPTSVRSKFKDSLVKRTRWTKMWSQQNWCSFAFFPMVLTAGCRDRQSKAHPLQKLNMLLRQIYSAFSFHWCNYALPQFSKTKWSWLSTSAVYQSRGV